MEYDDWQSQVRSYRLSFELSRYAMELPPPLQPGEIKDFDCHDDGASHSSADYNNDQDDSTASIDNEYSLMSKTKNSFTRDSNNHRN